MSQENVEVVRRSVEHINRTGEPAWDLFDPEITFRTRGDIESSSTYRGHDGLREAVRASLVSGTRCGGRFRT